MIISRRKGQARRLLCRGAAIAQGASFSKVRVVSLGILMAVSSLSVPIYATAEPLSAALARAYKNSPDLNIARSQLHASVETLNMARSGYRPSLNASASANRTHTTTQNGATDQTTTSLGLNLTQPLFKGFQTINSIRQAKAGIKAQQQSLANTEQNVLYGAAEAYLNLMRDYSIIKVRKQDVKFLNEQVKSAKDREAVGEGTIIDVALAKARLAEAHSNLAAAEASLNASKAVYKQLVGPQVGPMKQDIKVNGILKGDLETIIKKAVTNHPAIKAAQYQADSLQMQVKVNEGALLPSLDLNGGVESQHQLFGDDELTQTARIGVQLNVPIFNGGYNRANIRKSKHEYSQGRLQVNQTLNQIRAASVQAWGGMQQAKAQIKAAGKQIHANRLVLNGVQESLKVGEATILEVLDAKQDLLNAELVMIFAKRDKDVAAFNLLSTIGRLTVAVLDLPVTPYDSDKYLNDMDRTLFSTSVPDGQ